jgi:hypothetical protein
MHRRGAGDARLRRTRVLRCNHAVGEVSATIQHSQSGLYGWTVHHNIHTVDKASDRFRDAGRGDFVTPRQYRDQFAECGECQGNHVRIGQLGLGNLALPSRW